MKSTHEFLQNSALSSLVIEADGSNEVLMHEGTFFTLLINMCRNATKHGEARTVTIRVVDARERVSVEVLDDGKGIALEVAPRIFELGFSAGESSGLGLADGQKRMQMAGGDLVCEPHGGMPNKSGGKGAKFVFTFPRAGEIRQAL